MADKGWADFLREREDRRRSSKERLALSADRLSRIKEHSTTDRVIYPTHQEAFEYVHGLYPFACVKQAIVYKASKFILDDVGYRGVGGFYDTTARVIVITDSVEPVVYSDMAVHGEFTLDEVLVHELIHYAANFKDPLSSRNLEEQLAYGKSVFYLRAKGRTDDFIIKKNMMPYLVQIVDRAPIYRKILLKHYDEGMLQKCSKTTIDLLIERHNKEVFKEAKAEAFKLGEQIIRQYTNGQPQQVVQKTSRRLILGDEF